MTDKNLMSLEDRIPTDWKDENVSRTKGFELAVYRRGISNGQ